MSRKWVYGKQDWKTYERGQENCYLMTNGLGGFSSMTMTGSVARNDHAFLWRVQRRRTIGIIWSTVWRKSSGSETGNMYSPPSSLRTEKWRRYRYLSEFSYEDTPMWRFHVYGVEIVKEAAMKNGRIRLRLLTGS